MTDDSNPVGIHMFALEDGARPAHIGSSPAVHFEGATLELAEARHALAAGRVSDSIRQAGRSVDSVMKVLTGVRRGSADQLIRSMLKQHYFDDLPDHIRPGFAGQVLKTMPFLTNRLSGQGQDGPAGDLSPVYGELALHLAAAFHTFLISKHQEQATPALTPADGLLDGDIPF